MVDSKQIDQEPSIEEILDSIRQIISDDDEAESEEGAQTDVQAPAAASSPPDKAPEADEDAIELTNRIEDEPEQETVDEPMPPATQPIQVELKDRALSEPDVSEPEDLPEDNVFSQPEPEADMTDHLNDGRPDDFDKILTDQAEDAAVSAFSSLARKTAVEQHGNITIEDIVRDELRPLLRQWLDRHLPTLVEKLVQRELERVSSRVLDD